MPAPRPVYPRSSVFNTRSCTQGMYLLRPDPEMSNAVLYEAGYAAMTTGVELIMLMQMPNHIHDGVEDEHANVPKYNETFHKMVAKVGNRIRGREQNFFDDEQTSMVRLEETEDLTRKIVYMALNPVRAGLIERVKDWPGASGYVALITGTPLRATRPAKFHGKKSKMPAEIFVPFRIPARYGDPKPIIDEIVRRVTAFEDEEIARRTASGMSVMSRHKLLRQSPFESPTKSKKKTRIKPTIAAINDETRFEAIQRLRDFRRAYREALAAYRAGKPIPFPPGTYWLVRHLGVAVESAEKIG